MRSGRETGRADVAEVVSGLDFDAFAHGDQGHVPVAAVDAGSVIDDDSHAVEHEVAGPDHGSRSRSEYGISVLSGDVVAVMPLVGGHTVI